MAEHQKPVASWASMLEGVCCLMQVHAGEGLKQAQPGCSLPSAPSARHEYSSMDVTLEVVPDMAAAIDHIHANGSGHTGRS